MEQPKTKQAVEMLDALELATETVLVVLAERDMALERSFSNLPKAKTMVGAYLNVRDLLGYDRVLFSKEAIGPVEIWLGGESPSADAVEVESSVEAAQEVEAPAESAAADIAEDAAKDEAEE